MEAENDQERSTRSSMAGDEGKIRKVGSMLFVSSFCPLCPKCKGSTKHVGLFDVREQLTGRIVTKNVYRCKNCGNKVFLAT